MTAADCEHRRSATACLDCGEVLQWGSAYEVGSGIPDGVTLSQARPGSPQAPGCTRCLAPLVSGMHAGRLLAAVGPLTLYCTGCGRRGVDCTCPVRKGHPWHG